MRERQFIVSISFSKGPLVPAKDYKPIFECVRAKSLQSCVTLCDPMDHSPPSSSVHGILQARITGVGCHALLQGIFPMQGSDSCLLCLPVLAGGFLTSGATWEAQTVHNVVSRLVKELSSFLAWRQWKLPSQM